MPYKVTSPLVIVPNQDGESGDGYFYQDAVIPDGFNDDRCKQLAEEGMLEKVSASDANGDGDGTKEPSVKEILEGVGDDKEKAAAALAAEREARGDKARKTLVEPLEAILKADA